MLKAPYIILHLPSIQIDSTSFHENCAFQPLFTFLQQTKETYLHLLYVQPLVTFNTIPFFLSPSNANYMQTLSHYKISIQPLLTYILLSTSLVIQTISIHSFSFNHLVVQISFIQSELYISIHSFSNFIYLK